MARYHGRKGLIYLSTSGTGNATSFANLNSWSIDRSTDAVETTAFGDSNKTYTQGLPSVQGQFSGFYDDSASANLFTAADSSDGVKVYIYPSSDAVTKYAYGPAWISCSINGAVGAAVQVSGTFIANGSWGFNKL